MLLSFAGLPSGEPSDPLGGDRDRDRFPLRAESRGQLWNLFTTEANETVARIHDRMPVILPREAEEAWLRGEAAEAAALVKPYAGAVTIRAVSRFVSSSCGCFSGIGSPS